MRASASLGWRVATALAFGATAALAVALSRGTHGHVSLTSDKGAATPHASASARPASRCAAGALHISLGSGSRVSADITRYLLDFTNVSGTPCTLAGYPQVTAYQGSGVPVGATAQHDQVAGSRPVLLVAGQTGHATVESTVPAGRCHPVRAAGLRVVAPGGATARYVRSPLRACAARAPRGQHYLRVTAIGPGTGRAGIAAPSATSGHSAVPGRSAVPAGSAVPVPARSAAATR